MKHFYMLLLGLLICTLQSRAQYTVATFDGSNQYTAITKDNAGNIYAVKLNNTTNKGEVVKFTHGDPTPTVIYGNLSFTGGLAMAYSWGIAVNANGDVFVTNPNNATDWEIIKLAAPAYSASVIQQGRFVSTIAVDRNNNLLAMEYNSGTNSYQLVRYLFGAEHLSGSVLWAGVPLAPGGYYPTGIVVDSHDNIFVLDFPANNGGQLWKLTAPGFTPAVVASNKGYIALAIDAADNIYTTENISPTTSRIMKYTDPAGAGTQLYTGLSRNLGADPWGLVVHNSGTVYAGDFASLGTGRLITLSPPSITVASVTRADANPTSITTVTYNVTFSAAASNVTTNSFSLVTTGLTGSSITGVTGSGTTYQVTANTGTGATGTIRLDVNGTGISPIVSNVPFTSGETYNIDRVAPTGSISINGGATHTNNTSVTLTLTASDASTPLQMAFSINGGAYSAYEAFATTKILTLPAGDGLKSVSVRFRDAAANTAVYIDNITFDVTAPVTSLITTPANPTTSAVATFEFYSNETGSFEASLDGGAYSPVASPLSYVGLAEGNHTFSVRAIDAAGNVDATPETYPWTIDLSGPAITSVNVPADGYYKAGDVLTFTVHLNENTAVTGTPSIPVTIGSTTVQANYTGGSGSNTLTFAYTVQPGDMDMDGISLGNLALNGGTLKDALGHDANVTLSGVAPTTLVRVNTVTPTVTLSTTAPATVNTPFTITLTFSEPVSGLTVADLNVLSATVSNLQTSDNITYTMLLTPSGDGTYNMILPANSAFNIGNNGNSASNTLTRIYDVSAPTITSVDPPADWYYHAGDVLRFIAHFNEPISVNTTGGTPYLPITIGATTVNAAYSGATTNTISFRYTVVAGDMDMDGIAVAANIVRNGSFISDAANNSANLTLNNVGSTNNVFVNTAIPSVTISGTPALNGPWTATVTFSETVTGFDVSDITTTNASLSNFSVVNGFTYAVTVTPAADGQVTIQVPANVAQNIGGNYNSASSAFTYTYDNTVPTITSVTVPANGFYKAGHQLHFTVNFSENIAVAGGTPTLEVSLTSGTVQAISIANTANSITFRYTVQAGDMDADGITVNALQLNSSTIRDAATNNADLTLNNVGNTSGVIINTGTPSVTVGGAVSLTAPWTAIVTFSEAVTGFDVSDISLINATASNLQTTDNITYTVLVTPGVEGLASIRVQPNVAVNNANTGNTPSNSLSYYYDPNPPVITSVTVPANGYYKQGDVLNFTVSFNETVRVFGAQASLPVVIGGTTVQAGYVSGDNTNTLSFSYTVLNGEMDLDGISLTTDLQANGATIHDVTGNNAILTLQNVSNTSQVFVHTGYPTVTLSTTAAARVNAPFTVTVVFNEAVTGLTASDFTVTNGTAGTLTTTDNITYNLQVIPTADGAVSVQLAANLAQNIVNNGNQVSNTLSRNYDATAPVITAAQSFSILQNSTAGTQVGKVLATEAAGTLQNWTITSDGSGGAFAIDANGNITVQNGTTLNNNVGNTVTVNVTVSDGLNTSTVTPVAIKVAPINKAPLLDAINNVSICASTDAHTIQVTGASAVEPTQTYTLSIASNQAYFDVLTINNAGLINYSLKNNVSTGTATITVTIKDNGGTANGGVDTYQRSFTITVNPLPVITITSDKGNSVSKGDIAHLTATGGATYNWEANSSILSGQQTAIAEVRPQANITYKVTATSAFGCSSSATFNMSIIEDFKVDATNVLTPNGDGKNDKWVIRNIDSYPDNELKIFDRAGRLVFSQRNYNNTWDGRVNGHPLAEGTYYYYLSISGGAKTAKGYITIILKAN